MSAIYYEALELIKKLQDENTRLKADVDKLNATIQQMYVDFEKRIRKEAAHPACVKLNRLVGDKNNEIHRLNAEVARLTACLDDAKSEVESLNQEIRCIQACFDGPPPSEQEMRSHLPDDEGGRL